MLKKINGRAQRKSRQIAVRLLSSVRKARETDTAPTSKQRAVKTPAMSHGSKEKKPLKKISVRGSNCNHEADCSAG